MDYVTPLERGQAFVDQARERLARVSATSVFEACLQEIRRLPNDGRDWYARRPFISLLVMKWAAADWRREDARPLATADDLNFIFQEIWDATGQLQRSLGRHYIFLRRFVTQQLWYQQEFDIRALGRQAYLFCDLLAESAVVRSFHDETGIAIDTFARYLLQSAANVMDICGLPYPQEFRSEQREDERRAMAQLIRSQATSIEDFHRAAVQAAGYRTPPEVELCEQSPLIRTPFIETRRGYECIHHKLLIRALETMMYDVLRARGPLAFMREFGPAFESYVASVISELGGEISCEREIQHLLEGQGRCVDFLIEFNDAIVLIDAKGIEGHYDELYHNLPTVLSARMRTSALGAVDQAVGTLNRLPHRLRGRTAFFLCVTYKQMYVGSGEALRELTVDTPDWDDARWHTSTLPPANMFTISAGELEQMVDHAIATRTSLSVILRDIVRLNADPATRLLLLGEHLRQRQLLVRWPTPLREAALRVSQ
jgi:hypothetical protein